MKRISLVLSALFCLSLYADNEGLKVDTLMLLGTSAEARTQSRFDNNGEICALLKIQVLTEDSISFQGSYIVGDTRKKGNEYWIYLADGAKKISVSHPKYQMLDVNFGESSKGTIGTLDPGVTYRLVIAVPEQKVDTVLVEESFQDKLAEARKMYSEYASHSDPEYFRKAVTLYDAVKGHTDCPSSMLQELQQEQDAVKFMRKFTFLYEKANKIASEKALVYGYDSDSVYYYLKLAYKATLKLTNAYPGAKSFAQISKQAESKISNHSLGKKTETKVVKVERSSAYGVVTLKKSSQPLNTIAIYACKKSNPSSKGEKKLIGTVRNDGQYKVILPDGYSYIILDGENSAHRVSSANTRIDITL